MKSFSNHEFYKSYNVIGEKHLGSKLKTPNYRCCYGNCRIFSSKLILKIIMTELFKKPRKPCFWSLLTEAYISPQT